MVGCIYLLSDSSTVLAFQTEPAKCPGFPYEAGGERLLECEGSHPYPHPQLEARDSQQEEERKYMPTVPFPEPWASRAFPRSKS